MSFVYMVLLKPSEIRFTKNLLASEFDNGIPLSETFTQIKNGEILLEDVPAIEVVFYPEKWEWFTLNNRRLWVLKELEKIGKCRYVKTKRVEYQENIFEYPTLLYGSAALAEKNRTFTWEGDNLRITTRRTPSREVEIYHEEDERKTRQDLQRRGRSGSQHNEKNFKHCGSRTSRRRRRRKRYHPYCRHKEPRVQRELYAGTTLWIRQQSVDSLEERSRSRRNSETSEYSGLEYGFHFSSTLWFKKRQAFLQRVYCVRTGRLRDPSRFVDVLYTCGVCFKSFQSKVSLNQHSEELFHWACVRCGRFFETHTALGQHKLALNHTV